MSISVVRISPLFLAAMFLGADWLPALAQCSPSKVVSVFHKPDMETHGGDGRRFSSISNITVSIVEMCDGANSLSYNYIFHYHFYSGSGVQQANQAATLTFADANGIPIASDVFGIDFSRCIYGPGEDRNHEKSLGAVGALIRDVTISIPPGSGKVGQC